MPAFTRDDVRQLASLARLELTADETELYARQLGDILTFVRQVQAVDTSSVSVETTSAAGEDAAGFRDDAIQPSLDRDEVLAAAPDADTAGGLFKVPRVLNG